MAIENTDCSEECEDKSERKSWRSRTWIQMILLALCNFCSIGMWNSLNGLGGLGTGDERLAHYCNSCSYITGIFGGFISGSVVNCLGIRKSVSLGCVAMTIELSAYFLYYYVEAIPLWATVVINAIAGITISWMTSAIGAGLVHYPTDSERNTYIAIASAILNFGGLIGGVISLTMNSNASSTRTALSKTSYLTIILMSSVGIIFASLLSPSSKIVRTDGTVPSIPKRMPLVEVRDLFCAFKGVNLYLLAPLFSCNVWHEVVLFNYFNSTLFNVRSRAFNTICYYIARVASSFIFQAACDTFTKPSHCVLSAIVTVGSFVVVAGICGAIVFSGAYGIRDQTDMDFSEPRALSLIIAFFAYGSLETMASSFSFWLIGILPLGDVSEKNRYIGGLRMFTNLGGATSWLLDLNHHVPYLNQWLITSFLWVTALVGAWTVTMRTMRTTQKSGNYSELKSTSALTLPQTVASTMVDLEKFAGENLSPRKRDTINIDEDCATVEGSQ